MSYSRGKIFMSNNRNNQKQQNQVIDKKIVIAERDNIAALLENKKVTDFFIQRGGRFSRLVPHAAHGLLNV